MECQKCHQQIPDGSKFCNYCGAEQETDCIVCPKCGYKNPLDAIFCTDCGTSLVTKVTFDKISNYYCGLAKVQYNNKFGFVDMNENLRVPLIYDSAEDFSEGVTCVKQNGKWGMIDVYGQSLTDFIYDWMSSHWCTNTGLWEVESNGKYGYINKYGKITVPCIYDHFGNLYTDSKIISAMKNGKYGFLNLEGKVILPCEYDNSDTYEIRGYYRIKKNGRVGILEKSGKLLFFTNECYDKIDCIYPENFSCLWCYFKVTRNNKVGWLDLNGNVIIPCKFEDTKSWLENDGAYIVMYKGRKFAIDKHGYIVYKFTPYQETVHLSSFASDYEIENL